MIREIFDQIPSQLDSQSKRFTFASIAPRGTYERYENQVLWLVDAGVALPAISVTEPRHPLKLSEKRSYFKLFMDDVGLLCRACGMGNRNPSPRRCNRALTARKTAVPPLSGYGSHPHGRDARAVFSYLYTYDI